MLGNIKVGCIAILAVAALLVESASGSVVLNETFDYTDGTLTTVAAGAWASHSGTAGQVDVLGGKLNLTDAESEDVNATLTGQPYTSGTLYVGLDFSLSALPASTGAYFAHFKDAGASNFRGRIFVSTSGAGTGQYRVGITNVGTAPTLIPIDLDLNTTHRLSVAYDVANHASTLFLDAMTESGGTAAVDTTTTLTITSFAFRQASGIGTMSVDNVVVATAFADTVPEPASLSVTVLVALGLLSRRRAV